MSDSDDDVNPLADAMGASAESVAAASRSSAAKSSIAHSSTMPANSGVVNGEFVEEDEAASLSSYAKPAGSSSAASAPSSSSSAATALRASSTSNAAAASRPARARDEFDDELDSAVSGSSRRGVSATSSGYIDPRDRATIEQAQARSAAAKKQAPVEDEFEHEEVSDANLRSLAASNAASKPAGAFDEFADVWDDVNSGAAAAGGGRKVLKASGAQQKVEKPDAKEQARRDAEARRIAAKEREEALAREQEQHALQNPLLEKLGMGPTTILAQYDREAGSVASPSGSAAAAPLSAKDKARQEQRTLESNDAALAARNKEAAGEAPRANVVDALVSAHVGSNAPAAAAAEEQQWGAVNEVREKQLAAAALESARAAQAGKSIGVRAADSVSRDTPITYDAALKSLTQGPSAESVAASAAARQGLSDADAANAAASATPHEEYLASLRPRIQIHDFRNVGCIRSLRYKICGPPQLSSPRLAKERDLVFLTALMPVDHMRSIDHERMLLSLYRALTGDALAPPSFGNHWQVVGFQGNDPATDLRGAGLFALVQLMYFASKHRELMLKIYRLSTDERQNFPFCTLSTNLSAMVLQSLRECRIYAEAERRDSVYVAVNELYVATFYEMYLRWKNGHLTIVDWNETRQQLEDLVLHNPESLLAKFAANKGGVDGGGAGEQGALEFTEIP